MMTSYNHEVLQCPHCDLEFTSWNVASYNTFGARFYTDGCVIGDMYDETSSLLICPGCNRFLWRKDLPLIEEIYDLDFDQTHRAYWLKMASRVHREHYPEILKLKRVLWRTPEEEKFIRIRAWWVFNNPYREKPEQDFVLSPECEDNLRRLLPLLNVADIHETILRAEIFRELGQFEDCLKALYPASKKEPEVKTLIRYLAVAGKRQAALINKNEIAKQAAEPVPACEAIGGGIYALSDKDRYKLICDSFDKMIGRTITAYTFERSNRLILNFDNGDLLRIVIEGFGLYAAYRTVQDLEEEKNWGASP